MKRFTILASALLSCQLASTALADKFHFSEPDAPEHQQRILEGVLLEETDTDLRIRVEGGEITIPKGLVRHVEKDGLTVAQLEQRESDAREGLALANQTRRAMQAEEAALRATARREVAAREAAAAAAREEIVVEASAPLVIGYDPVIHRAVTIDTVVEREIRRGFGGEVRRAAERELAEIRREMRRAARQLP